MTDPIPVQPMDPTQPNSPVAGPIGEEATVMLDQAKKVCVWNGREYPDGAIVESDGVCFECSYGQWVRQD